MITINANFLRLSDVTLSEVYDATGVYVLWSGKSKAYPSYIGEGYILDRLSSHMGKKWAARPIDGVIGFVDANTGREQKIFSEILETSLLNLSDYIDRYPTHNKSYGKYPSSFDKVCRRAGYDVKRIRINIYGRDPLRHPSNTEMYDKKQISIKKDETGWLIDYAHWVHRPVKSRSNKG